MDFAALLAKYIHYVAQCEGTDFIQDGFRSEYSDLAFTENEWRELKRLAETAEQSRRAIRQAAERIPTHLGRTNNGTRYTP